MNVIVNKKLNESYLEKYLTSIMSPQTEAYTGFKVYTDLSTDLSIGNGEYSFMLFVSESYLTLIDTLNTKQFNGTLNLNGADFTLVINSLYDNRSAVRNSVIDYLVTNGVVTEAEVAGAKTLATSFKNFDINILNMHYVDTTIPGNEALTDVIEYSYDTPVELSIHYDVANNTNGEALYLIILPLINKNFGGTDGTYGDYVSTQKFQNVDTTALQSTYIAVAIGDINDATADVKYDHVDKIDYIDSFRLRFRLPKVLN